MLTEENRFLAQLDQEIRARTQDAEHQKDLRQAALLHIWKLEIARPGYARRWYLQACRFCILDQLRGGRSVDSLKRRGLVCPLEEVTGEGECVVERALVCERDPLQAAILADFITELERRLEPGENAVLALMAEGYGERETARRLGISHTTVVRRRRAIANTARKMEAEH